MKIVQTSEIFGDETANYEIDAENMTLSEFIKEYSNEYVGRIKIVDGPVSALVVMVRNEKSIEIVNNNYYEFYKDKLVLKATAKGGWGFLEVLLLMN